VRTLWELVSAMRDTSVTVIELRRHIGLIGHPLPRIERGRDLTIVGVCDNEAGAKNVTALYDASSKRRRLAQVKHASATKNVYTGAHGDLFGPESEMLLRKHIAEILGVQGILNETTPFVLDPIAPFPVYQSDLSPSSDVSTRSNDIFSYKKGTRFLVQRGVEYFAQGTVYAFGGDAFGVGHLGGAAMYVAANWVDVPVEHTFLVNSMYWAFPKSQHCSARLLRLFGPNPTTVCSHKLRTLRKTDTFWLQSQLQTRIPASRARKT
jgi:hypothetical protein